jgi:uncharacterized protein with PQ loop repeat
MNALKVILISVAIVTFDLAVYLVLGLLMMNYDDFYDESEGEYWSLGSMTISEKATYIGLNVWHVVNFIAVGYVTYRIIRRFTKKRAQYITRL